jgi:hypothetical protein
MLNTFWEELNMSDEVLKFHEEELSKWNLPKWVNIDCPFCGKKQPLRSIRSVSIKFNTRNLGDLALEVCCFDCHRMDTLYFQQEIDKITDVIPFLTGEKEPKNKPILEEKMYELKYNNVVEKMVNAPRRSVCQ